MGIKIKGQYMKMSTFQTNKYMNGSVFIKARYMNGVGSEILVRTPVPQLPPSYPPPPLRGSVFAVLLKTLWIERSAKTDQTALMRRLIWIFAGLSCRKCCAITKTYLYNFDPLKPHFYIYNKTGVYRGIHYFSYFCSKHRLWVLVRTASPRRF